MKDDFARTGSTRADGDAPRRPVLCGQEVPRAGHICAFFDSSEEKYEVLASYLGDAIASGDRVIDVVEARSREDHIRGMTDAGVDMSGAIERGQLHVGTCEETYYREGGLDLEGVLDMLRHELGAARDAGVCVRTAGEMNWVARDESQRQRALEYEARVNEFLPDFDCTLLCVYDLAHTPSTMIADILATHPFAIVKGRLRANPWVIETGKYMEMLRANAATPPAEQTSF